MKKKIVIVGAGPGGLFAATKLCKHFKVLLIEMGRPIDKRVCSVKSGNKCASCKPCNILHGVGGAGLFSDGKLNFHPKIGGNLTEFLLDKDIEGKFKQLDRLLKMFGDKSEIIFDSKFNYNLKKKAIKLGLKFIPIKQKHLGSENMVKIVKNIIKYLNKNGTRILTEKKVVKINHKNNRIISINLSNGETIEGDIFIFSTGLATQEWLYKQINNLGIKSEKQSVHIGVRIEFDAKKYAPITDHVWDPKLFFYSDAKKHNVIRTYCTNPYGFVLSEKYKEFLAVNGHAEKKRTSQNTNFALMTEVKLRTGDNRKFGESFCKRIFKHAKNKPLIQRYNDFINNNPTNKESIISLKIKPTLLDVTPGNLNLVIPKFLNTNLRFAFKKLNGLIDNFCDENLLIYAPEIKFDTYKIKCRKDFSTKINNLFIIGDGGGISRGLAHAAISGLVVSETIFKMYKT